MQNLIKTMLVVSVLCLFGCADDPDVAPLKRDTDAVEVAYNTDATAQFTVRFNGPWQTSVLCEDESGAEVASWFTVTPDNGTGNGRDYQYLTVTAQRNAGKSRTGYVYLQPRNSAAEPLKITVTQGDGIFSVSKPVINGTMKSGSASTSELLIEYDKAFGGETVVVTSALSGEAAAGLEIRDQYETTIPEEGSGTLSIPITGTPAFLGKLICNVTVKLDGAEIFSGDVEGSVVSSNEIFRFGFDLFVWGGDYINNKAGVGPNGTSAAGKTFMGTEPTNGTISAGTDGTNDVFLTMTDQYRINRGVENWDGSKVYEHPGYLKIGTGSASGWIMTPELTGLSSAPETVVLSIDFCRFNNETGTYYVTAEGAGVVTNGTVDAMVLPAPTNASERKWTTLTFTIEGATNKTRVKLSASDLTVGSNRMNVDNFVVMGAAKAEVTEQLPAPAADKIVFVPAEESIEYSWEGVKGATGYVASVAAQTAPDFRKTVETAETSHTFADLTPGYYIFTVKALYAENPEFDSEETVLLSGTLGYPVEKLAAPSDLACVATSTSLEVTWTHVPGAVYYMATLYAGTGTELKSEKVTDPKCVFEDLAPGTTFRVAVQAFVAEGSEFNSDVAELAVATIDPKPMTAPAVQLYAKTHGWAVIEWELSEKALAEQALVNGNVDTYDFRVKDASGNVMAGYELNNYSKFAFIRYKFFRFVFGGLKPATSYTIEMRRKPLANNKHLLDSEWVSVPVTTDPAPDTSGYLLYADFDNHPYGVQPQLCAYGCSVGAVTDFVTQIVLGTSASANYVYSPTGKWTDESYCTAYMPQWSSSELKDTALNSNVHLAVGAMKFGASSKPAWLTLPRLTALGGATDVILELDAAPYIEPSKTSATSGSMEQDLVANESLEFYVKVTGATVAETSGTVRDDVVTLTNIPSPEMGGVGAEALKRFMMTSHTLKLSGVTADTRIMIYTALENDSKQHRMWMDNVRIKRAE